MLSIFSCDVWPSTCLLWRNVYLDYLPIFNLVYFILIVVSQSPSQVQLFETHVLHHARPLCPSPPLEVCPSSYPLHWWCHPAISSSDALFSFCPQIFPSIRDFSNESAIHTWWPKYWSFCFSISPSNEYSGLIFLNIDWFDLLTLHGMLFCYSGHHEFITGV